MKVRGWQMFHVGILRRTDIWVATPAGPLTFHLTILVCWSHSKKFPSTNSQESFYLFSWKERRRRRCVGP